MTTSELILLDTNILIQVIRQNALGRKIDAEYALSSRTDRPLISIVTIGEGLSLGRQFSWGEDKLRALRDLFRNLVVVDISRPGIVERYAELADGARRAGRGLGQNDLWIAATASVARATLLTTDRDFDAVDSVLLRRVWIDPKAA